MEQKCTLAPKPKTVGEFFRSRYFWKPFIAISVGALGGFLYYYYIGCSSGACAIGSNPYMSVVTGGFIGWFMINSPCSSGKC